MTASLGLLAAGIALLIEGPRLAGAGWTRRIPRLGVLAWQALLAGVVAAVVLAGLTLLIPVTALADDLGSIVHACAVSIASAYGSAAVLPSRWLGLLLAGVVPAWILLTAARVLGAGWVRRRRLHRSLGIVTEPLPELGASLMHAAAPAAFCVPGRASRIVVTSGALQRLSQEELAGVLAHERAHLRERHNLAVALPLVLSRAFPRVALFRTAALETVELIELLADDAATRRVDAIEVASAIVSLSEMRAPSAAMAMAVNAAALRVARLLHPAPPATPWLQRLQVAGVLAVAFVPLAVAVSPAVFASLTDGCGL